MSELVRISDVTPEQLAATSAYLDSRGVTGLDGPSGTLSGPGIDGTYSLDAQGVLTVELENHPAGFANIAEEQRPERFEALVRAVLADPGTLGKRPNHPGVYNYVLPTIDNQSGSILTYSSSNLPHGTISITTQRYEVGDKAQAFEADSTGGSGLGVEGSAVYTVGSGAPLLTLTFWLNGNAEHSFTAGLTGGNAYLYSVSYTGTDPHVDSYTYLEPTVTITRA